MSNFLQEARRAQPNKGEKRGGSDARGQVIGSLGEQSRDRAIQEQNLAELDTAMQNLYLLLFGDVTDFDNNIIRFKHVPGMHHLINLIGDAAFNDLVRAKNVPPAVLSMPRVFACFIDVYPNAAIEALTTTGSTDIEAVQAELNTKRLTERRVLDRVEPKTDIKLQHTVVVTRDEPIETYGELLRTAQLLAKTNSLGYVGIPPTKEMLQRLFLSEIHNPFTFLGAVHQLSREVFAQVFSGDRLKLHATRLKDAVAIVANSHALPLGDRLEPIEPDVLIEVIVTLGKTARALISGNLFAIPAQDIEDWQSLPFHKMVYPNAWLISNPTP